MSPRSFGLNIVITIDADMNLDLGPDSVMSGWTESRGHIDPSLFCLSSCFPTSFMAKETVFFVSLNDWNFNRLVTGDHMIYTKDLTYISSHESPSCMDILVTGQRTSSHSSMILGDMSLFKLDFLTVTSLPY